MISQEMGCLINSKSSEELSQVLIELLSNELRVKEIKEFNRNYALRVYSPRLYLSRVFELLN
jgi:hypothetical protein